MPASPSPDKIVEPPGAKKNASPAPAKAKAAASKQPPMKPADFGKAIGIDKPANVRAKIQKWQAELDGDASGAENADVAPVPSPLKAVDKLAPSPKLRPTPKPAPLEDKPNPQPDRAPKQSAEAHPDTPQSAKKPVMHNKLDEEVHVATAPKKRVVSDSHWRTKKSPPKDGTKRPSPKPLPTAWVRPAARRAENAEVDKQPSPAKEPRSFIVYTSKVAGQRPQTSKQRRQSGPSSSSNEEPETTSGTGSAKGLRGGDERPTTPASPPTSPSKADTELVRVRRRRRSGPSPRSSLSADDPTPAKDKPRPRSSTSHTEDLANLITVEYDSSHPGASRDNDIRERRRRSRRKDSTSVAPEVAPEDRAPKERRHSRRPSHQPETDDNTSSQLPEPAAPQTPPQVFGSRLEAWLQTTPDLFVDADSRTRRPSKDSVSTSDLSRKQETPNASATADLKDATPTSDQPLERKRSRRKRRSRGAELNIDTNLSDDRPAHDGTPGHSGPSVAKDEETTPTPTLKRRGARRSQHSPTKDRTASAPLPNHGMLDEDATSSAPSSSLHPSATEFTKPSIRPLSANMAIRRNFQFSGKRLSTIASVETFTAKLQAAAAPDLGKPETVDPMPEPTKALAEVPASDSGAQSAVETVTTISRKGTKRSKLATHADLMSVLSMPRAGNKSIMSARSIRTNRSRLATATMSDIMNELNADETKYMRELRTLVDGVIPVLLSCVLSKSDSTVAAGLFSRSSKTDPTIVTKPIVDMGISLERLKSLHRRIPKDNPAAFLSWAQSAQRVYSDYINAWRLGFEDVVVSLAPADEDPFKPSKVVHGPEDAAPWDEGLPRNSEGYVVNGDGERVDVAYMLKRPLVRLKYLAKSLRGINHLKPSEQAEKMSDAFQDLVTAARKRSNDERARLEDEAAASIDPTRARDPRSLAPLAGVRIDSHRCVRARDYFDMHFFHSSGQEINCRVEILLRDDAPGSGSSGDVLFCEVDHTGRWLLLPPIQVSRISARNGDLKGEIIVMIRGYHADGKEWCEVCSLRGDDEQAGFEWVQMLGLQPVPPQISELTSDRTRDEASRPTSSHASSSLVSAATASTLPQKSRTPSPREIEIPIGEQAKPTSRKWGSETPDRKPQSREVSPITPPSSELEQMRLERETPSVSPEDDLRSKIVMDTRNASPRTRKEHNEEENERTPRSLNEAMMMAGSESPTGLRRTRAKRLSKNLSPSPTTAARSSRQIVVDDPEEEVKPPRKLTKRPHAQSSPSTMSSLSQTSKGFNVWMPSSQVDHSDEHEDDDNEDDGDHTVAMQKTSRPQAHRRASSVPSMDLPTITKIRKASQPVTPVKEPSARPGIEVPEPPASAPSKLQKKNPNPVKEDRQVSDDDEKPPPVPPHRSPSPASPMTIKAANTPVFTPNLPGFKTRRRSSSPLKHEYEPSTCTESSSESESEEETSGDEERSATSESSEDELDDDVPMPLLPIGQLKQFPRVSPPSSIYTLPNGTITPSQSASNTPYRAVPQNSGQAARAVATIWSWSDTGKWDSLHPDDCSIVVTPGKIEVFEITAAHSKPFMADGDEIIQPEGRAPLIAVELTPLVPMRKSTAIDITVRSPPTAESRIKSGNNIMLRSRNAVECAQLYDMMNRSRMNNPTYIALQNARGPYGQPSWAEAMDRQNAARSNAGSSGGWFTGTLGRRSSYRKTSTRAASISAATESSVGTMNTALRSALGRFSFGRNNFFNIRNSTLGSRSNHSYDSGSNGSGSGTSTPTHEPGRAPGAPAGITNTKCRLYERDSFSSKWRDMGAARLTIMLPDPSTSSATRQGKGSPGMRDLAQEKRILVIGKSKSETLLDVTLNESCFERIARLGIAVSVWEDVVGPNGEVGTVGKYGGVSGARARVFMIQMKTERECAFSYSLLGKLRY